MMGIYLSFAELGFTIDHPPRWSPPALDATRERGKAREAGGGVR
jgi:hypothetical protein